MGNNLRKSAPSSAWVQSCLQGEVLINDENRAVLATVGMAKLYGRPTTCQAIQEPCVGHTDTQLPELDSECGQSGGYN